MAELYLQVGPDSIAQRARVAMLEQVPIPSVSRCCGAVSMACRLCHNAARVLTPLTSTSAVP